MGSHGLLLCWRLLGAAGGLHASHVGSASHGVLLPAAGRHGVQPAPVGHHDCRLHSRVPGRALACDALRGQNFVRGLRLLFFRLDAFLHDSSTCASDAGPLHAVIRKGCCHRPGCASGHGCGCLERVNHMRCQWCVMRASCAWCNVSPCEQNVFAAEMFKQWVASFHACLLQGSGKGFGHS